MGTNRESAPRQITDSRARAAAMAKIQSFSCYKQPVSNCRPYRTATVPDIYQYVTSSVAKNATDVLRSISDPAAARQYKNSHFDHCTFAGVFTYRASDGLKSVSGLLCLDFDNLEEQQKDYDILFDELVTDPILDVRLMFRSPSGDGLKCVIAVDLERGTFAQFYKAAARHCLDRYSVKADPSCCNVDRTCYLPYDPEAYCRKMIGDSSCDLALDPEVDQCSSAGDQLTVKRADLPPEKRAQITEDVETVIARIEAAKIDVTGSYQNWLSVGYALADFFGADGRSYYHRISRFYVGEQFGNIYTVEDTDRQFDQILSSRQRDSDSGSGNRATIRTLFEIAKQHGVDVVSGCHYFETADPFEDFRQICGTISQDAALITTADPQKLTAAAATVANKQMILDALLKEIAAANINIRQKAGLKDPDQKLHQKDALVIIIDELLRIAKEHNWGMATSEGFLYIYNGCFWQSMTVDDIKPFLSQVAIKMGYNDVDARYFQFQDNLLKQFNATALLPTIERDPDRILVNLQNGTFEIPKGKQPILRDPQRKDFLKYQLPFPYDPEAKCPIFEAYLKDVLPDQSCQNVLAEYVGYIFTSGMNLQKVAILYGSGANGKSVFFDVITALLGAANTSSYSLTNLTKYDSYQRAELSTKLLNYASEISGKLETSIFKQLACGEPVEARQIWGKPYIMTNYAKLMFNCNELPKSVELTEAFFRRFLIIPFTQTIPEERQDPELAQKIISSELSGVFNWVLAGLDRIRVNRKFTRSAAIDRELQTYRKESDSVAIFVDDCNLKKSADQSRRLSEVFGMYRSYCNDNGYSCASAKTLIKRLRSLGYETVKKRDGQVVMCTATPYTDFV